MKSSPCPPPILIQTSIKVLTDKRQIILSRVPDQVRIVYSGPKSRMILSSR